MKMSSLTMAFGAIALGVVPVMAQDATQLAQSKGCMTCHALDQAKMGPSFKDVAAKYKGQGGAAATLVTELKDGTGHMKIDASDAELQQLIGYVLAAQ